MNSDTLIEMLKADLHPSMPANLVSVRWQLEEFLFVEFVKKKAIRLELGPFRHKPTDVEYDQAQEYLRRLLLDFLTLGPTSWDLDAAKFARRFPIIANEGLSGILSRPAAFGVAHAETEGQYYLRLSFDLPLPKFGESFRDDIAIAELSSGFIL